jgi:hypothetical protein
MPSYEASYAMAAALISIFVTLVYVGKMGNLGDETAHSLVVDHHANVAREVLDNLLETYSFSKRGEKMRRDETFAKAGSQTHESQKPLILFEKIMGPLPFRTQVIAVNGEIMCDTSHKNAGDVAARPFAQLANFEMVDTLLDTASKSQKGSFSTVNNNSVFVTQLRSYPSFMIVVEDK